MSLFGQAPDPGNVVRVISIRGAERESPTDLKLSLKDTIQVGDDYSDAKVSEAAGKLARPDAADRIVEACAALLDREVR